MKLAARGVRRCSWRRRISKDGVHGARCGARSSRGRADGGVGSTAAGVGGLLPQSRPSSIRGRRRLLLPAAVFSSPARAKPTAMGPRRRPLPSLPRCPGGSTPALRPLPPSPPSLSSPSCSPSSRRPWRSLRGRSTAAGVGASYLPLPRRHRSARPCAAAARPRAVARAARSLAGGNCCAPAREPARAGSRASFDATVTIH